MVDEERAFNLVRMMTGARVMNSGAKSLMALLTDRWIPGTVTTPIVRDQALRVLRCMEIAAGFQAEKSTIRIDNDLIPRWQDLGRRALSRVS